MHASLKDVLCLNHIVKVYVPSTQDVNCHIDNTQFVELVCRSMGQWFGGATSFDALGVWEAADDSLVQEKVKIVQSFADEASFQEHMSKVIDMVVTIKREMGQESVALEVDNLLYLF